MTALSARLISVKKGGVRRSYMIPGLGWYLRVFGGQCQCQCKATSLWNILTLAKTILNIPLQILANLLSANYFNILTQSSQHQIYISCDNNVCNLSLTFYPHYSIEVGIKTSLKSLRLRKLLD